MTRFARLAVLFLVTLAPTLALAQQVHVAIVGVRGKGGGATAVQGLQGALQKLRGITFESTRNFLAEADQRGVADRVETDPKSMSQVARALEVDAVVSGTLDEAKRSKDKVLTLSVYNGGDGKLLGEEVVEVPGGKLTAKTFTAGARAIEPYIRMGDHKPGPGALAAAERPARPAPVTEPPVETLPGETVADESEAEPAPGGAEKGDFLRIQGGLSFRKRTFRYKTTPREDEVGPPKVTYILPDGISYDSSLAPGLGLAVEVYPLALSMTGAVTGLGLTFGYEQVFLTSKQTITTDETTSTGAAEDAGPTELDTTERVIDLGIKYRYAFGKAGAAPELMASFGMAWSTFELEKNDEYRGTNYRYPHLGLGGRIPFGTPLVAAELELRYIPTADAGETTQELGKSADLAGYGLTADIVSQFGAGFLATVGIDYTAISGDVKGEGRSKELVDAAGETVERKVRLGKSIDDSYLGIHVRAGYHF
jgi:hypothetical protein